MLSCTRESLARLCLVQNADSPAPNKPRQTWDRSPLLFRAALPPAAYSPIVRSHEYASREQPRNNNWPAHSRAGRAQTARAFLHCTAALQARPSRFFPRTDTQPVPSDSNPPLRKVFERHLPHSRSRKALHLAPPASLRKADANEPPL